MPEGFYILISDENEMSFCTFNDSNKSVNSIETHSFRDFSELKTYSFPENSSLHIIYTTACYSFIPSIHFDEAMIYDYLKISCPLDDHVMVLYERVDTYDLVDVYAVPAPLFEIFSNFGTNHIVRHHAGILTDALNKYTSGAGDAVLVNKGKVNMDIMVRQNGKLALFERFPFSGADEFVYYILNVYKQLGLQKDSPLLLSGNIGLQDKEYMAISHQLNMIHFVENKDNIILPEGMEFHRNFNLLSAITCG